MQIFFLKPHIMILLFFILWPLMQVTAALLCRRIPISKLNYNSFIFKSKKWEKEGRIYKKLFNVHKWKKFLPDGDSIVKGGFPKKSLKSADAEYIGNFIAESARAELSHIIAIFPFWVFGFFAPPIVIPLMLIYALLVNMPCIIAQRYNRPRLIKLYLKLKNTRIDTDNTNN